MEASVGPDDGGRDLETSRGNALGNEDNQVEDYQQPERKDWLDLPMLTKLDSMHLLTEWQFQNPTRFRTLMKSDDEDASWVRFLHLTFSTPVESMQRIEPIGYDAKSNAYWLIGGISTGLLLFISLITTQQTGCGSSVFIRNRQGTPLLRRR